MALRRISRRNVVRQSRVAAPMPATPRAHAALEDKTAQVLSVLKAVDQMTFIRFAESAIIRVRGVTQEGVGLEIEVGGHEYRVALENAREIAAALAADHSLGQTAVVEQRVNANGERYEVFTFAPKAESLF